MQHWITALCGDLRHALGQNLVALVLGGSYGRGEGGVLRVLGEERPYNDLDLVQIVRRTSFLPWHKLRELQHKHESVMRIRVDFSRPLTIDNVRRWQPTLMWSELLRGHHVLDGPGDILTANAPDLRTERLVPVEATRLLLNRGAGLLWAIRVLRGCEPAPDADFIRRNYYKCALALGEAVLIVHGCFAGSYARRDEMLSTVLREIPRPLSFDMRRVFSQALTFKFWPGEFPDSPSEPQLAEMARQWGEIFLYVENSRGHCRGRGMQEYVEARGVREPEQHTLSKWPCNFVRNRQLGLWSVRCARETLYRDLPVLLGLCNPRARDWSAQSARFLAVWQRVN
jgi:hypothetical protein